MCPLAKTTLTKQQHPFLVVVVVVVVLLLFFFFFICSKRVSASVFVLVARAHPRHAAEWGHVFGERDGGVFGRNFARRETLRVLGRERNSNAWGTSSSLVKNSKKNDVDLVTATDEKCEKMIKECISEAFPEHSIVGEEETARAGDVIPQMSAQPTWYVDPVDGTTNFIHPADPNSCVSIGLCVNEEPVVGVVFNPISREMFVGVKGRGSQLIKVGGRKFGRRDGSAVYPGIGRI